MKEEERIEDVKPEIVGGAKGSEDIGILGNSHESDTTSGNTEWHQIRKGLREELGSAVDEAWFSKAVAAHCNDTKILTLTMPTRFMADWIKNNYSHVIIRFSEGCGIMSVEYRFD